MSVIIVLLCFFFKQKTAYEMRISDWSSDVCSSDLRIRAAENVPASISDRDDATRQLTGYSSRGMGPGQRAVRDHVQRRQSNMAQRMRQHVDESLGSTVNPHQQAANLTEQARAAAAPLYREAYQHPVDLTPNLAEFADSPFGPAIGRA